MKRICALLASIFFVGSLFAEIECWEDPHTGIIWYYSIREYDKTIELGSWTDMHSCVSNVYSGELSIPEKINGRLSNLSLFVKEARHSWWFPSRRETRHLTMFS